MKKLILSILCAAVFFIGLGGLIQETGARFKSDERALDLIKQAQTAIGGEAAVQNVKSLSITGTVSKTFDSDGTPKTEQGDLEINMQLPNQLARTIKMRHADNSNGAKTGEVKREVNVLVMREGGEAPIFKPSDLGGQDQVTFDVKKRADGKTVLTEKRTAMLGREVIPYRNGGFHQNELFRMTLALLMTTPQGADATFTHLGDGDVDGNACDIIEAKTNNSTFKLFLDKSSHLPRMMSYQGFKPVVIRINKDEARNSANPETRAFSHQFEKPETAEFQVRFSDYRSVEGVLLPHRWTQTIGGNADETIDITGYEINPANIAEKFQKLPVREMIRIPRNVQ